MVCVINHRSHRHPDDHIFSGLAVHVYTFSMHAVFGFVNGFINEVDEGSHIGTRFHEDIPATAAVTTVRTAIGNEFFTAKAQTAVTAASRFYRDGDFINNHDSLFDNFEWLGKSV